MFCNNNSGQVYGEWLPKIFECHRNEPTAKLANTTMNESDDNSNCSDCWERRKYQEHNGYTKRHVQHDYKHCPSLMQCSKHWTMLFYMTCLNSNGPQYIAQLNLQCYEMVSDIGPCERVSALSQDRVFMLHWDNGGKEAPKYAILSSPPSSPYV